VKNAPAHFAGRTVTTHCDGCIVVHTDAALKAGATKEENRRGARIAVGMNAGAALVYSTRRAQCRRSKIGASPTAANQFLHSRMCAVGAQHRLRPCRPRAQSFAETDYLTLITFQS